MDGRTKIVDDQTGAQVVKGGILYGTGFFPSIFSAYANLVHRPIVLVLGAYLVFSYLAIEAGINTPTAEIKSALLNVNETSTVKWEKALATVLFKSNK